MKNNTQLTPADFYTEGILRLYGVHCVSHLCRVFILLLISLSSFGQDKHDNSIIIHGVTFPQVVKTLINNNYHIAKIDSIYKTIELQRDQAQVIYFRMNDAGDVIMSSEYYAMVFGTEHAYQAERKDKYLWRDMMKIADQFPNKEYASIR